MEKDQILTYCRAHRTFIVAVLCGLVILEVGVWFWYLPSRLADLSDLRQGAKLRVVTSYESSLEEPVARGLYELQDRLSSGLAASLGTRVEQIPVSNRAHLLQQMRTGQAHLGLIDLTINPQLSRSLRHSMVFATSQLQVVYQRGSQRPRTAEDLVGRNIVVSGDSAASFYLLQLQRRFPDLRWRETKKSDNKQLLLDVVNGQLQTTIVDRNLLDEVRLLYPLLAVGYEIPQPLQWAWVMPKMASDSFVEVVDRYLRGAVASGLLDALQDRLLGAPVRFDFVDTRSFHRAVVARLPALLSDFQLAGAQTGVDWKLLAAQAYQESHWDPRAVSSTGARGLMQLTGSAANQFAVADPFDPWQAVLGGARYLRQLIARLPAKMSLVDRRWAALAAYNYGMKNILEARSRATTKGRNPNYWVVIRDELLKPQISVPEPVGPQRIDRARQAVRYVRRIRGYYRILSSPMMVKYTRNAPISN